MTDVSSCRRIFLSALVMSVAACTTQPLVKVSDGPTVPPELFKLTCNRIHPNSDAHFDGQARLLSNSGAWVVGVACSFTTMEAGLETVTVNIDIRVSQAQQLRAFLAAQGATSSAEDDKRRKPSGFP